MKTKEKLFTRQQRLDNECTHEEYYSQFVTQGMINTVIIKFGKDKLIEAFKENEHFNSIILVKWDSFGKYYVRQMVSRELFNKAGDYCTLAGLVCIGKQAAREAINL